MGDEFYALLNIIASDKLPSVVLGDFNFDLLIDSSFAYDIETTFGLKQYINEPTRVTPTTHALLDHVYTLGLDQVTCSVDELYITDHRATRYCLSRYSKIYYNAQLHKKCLLRSMKNLDSARIHNDLASILWMTLCLVQVTPTKWSQFLTQNSWKSGTNTPQ